MRVLSTRSLTRQLCVFRLKVSTQKFPYSTSLMSAPELGALNQSIQEQSALLRTLREQSAEPSRIDEAHKKLGDLRRTLGQLTAAGKERDKADGKKKDRLLLKTAKGTRDFGPAETACRSHIESIIKDVFTSFGGTGLDTPVFERKDILAGKYGEDAKLIFDLADQGGEQLALRYDHTVSALLCFI
jgi:histidyl-tRNA synthetase